MTSRTTPVGVVVLILASLFAVGCTAQTTAVFEALVDPARAPASPSEPDAPVETGQQGSPSQVWWAHPGGYRMTLPAGWSGAAVNRAQADRLIDAVGAEHAGAAERIRGVLQSTDSRVSAIAADLTTEGPIAPMLFVVQQPTEGRGGHGVKTRVHEQILALPGRQGRLLRDDVRLPAGSGVVFDFMIADGELGVLNVRSYLFRFGSQAYLVSFVASEDAFDDAVAVFEAIATSLHFGV